jgi:hypothetical protein
LKRVLLIVACVSLPLALTGCDFFSYIWQHIIGHSYSQVDLKELEAVSGNMSSSPIYEGSLPINTVVGYRTRNGNLGKLAITSSPGSDLRFQLTTYDAVSGSVIASSAGLSISSNSYCDLESGTEVGSTSPSDFLWRSDGTLVPQSGALFYVFP